jgi:hypothetical protein
MAQKADPPEAIPTNQVALRVAPREAGFRFLV